MPDSSCDAAANAGNFAQLVMRNDSYVTPCAEFDNVHLALLKDTQDRQKAAPASVTILTRAPRYQNLTNMNNRTADWSDCPKSDDIPDAQPLERPLHCDPERSSVSGVSLGGVWQLELLCEDGWKFGAALYTGGSLTSVPFTMLTIQGPTNTFVLYSNGFTRSMYLTPSWLPPPIFAPMGSSVVIGPMKPKSALNALPWVPLDTVELVPTDPPALKMTIDQTILPGAQTAPYTIFMTAPPTYSEFSVRVDGLSWSDTAIPYMMLSSMFVRTGKSDSETITTSDGVTRPLLISDNIFPGNVQNEASWEYLSSNSYGLTRQCLSGHNTRSPDTYITFGC